MRSSLLIGIFVSIVTSICFSQSTFEMTYGTPWRDEGRTVRQTVDDGYIIAAETTYPDSGILIVKTDPTGAIIWSNTYEGEFDVFGDRIIQTSDGEHVIIGNACLFKINSTGNVEWYNSDIGGHSVIQTTDGGYTVLSGRVLVKTNSTGDELWTVEIDSTEASLFSLVQTSDGGYACVGCCGPITTSDVCLVKTNSTGNFIWEQTYGGAYDDDGYCLQQTSDDGFILVGSSASFGEYTAAYLIKTNSMGDVLWEGYYWFYSTYGYEITTIAYSVVQTTDGGYILSASRGFGLGLIKVSSVGDTVWTNYYGGYDVDGMYSFVQQTSDDGFIVVGSIDPEGADQSDIFLIKTDATGWSEIKSTISIKPRALSLTAFPNPFNSSVAISAPAGAEIDIYDLRGNVVKCLNHGFNGFNGLHGCPTPNTQNRTFIWRPDKTIASGIYLVKAKMKDGLATTRRVVYLK